MRPKLPAFLISHPVVLLQFRLSGGVFGCFPLAHTVVAATAAADDDLDDFLNSLTDETAPAGGGAGGADGNVKAEDLGKTLG